MKRYMFRYLIFWLPAVLVAYLYNNSSILSQILQWVFSSLMILGWSVNTGMAAYHFPRRIFTALLVYSGLSMLMITLLYASQYGTPLHDILDVWGGIFCFKPLSIFIEALLEFSIPHEIYVTGLLVVCCLVGYLAGVLHRRNNPNPYRPKIIRK